MKKLLIIIVMVLFSIFVVSCDEKNEEPDLKPNVEEPDLKPNVEVNVESDSLYVQKVENLKDNFIFGADISSVISLEQAGVKYYDYNGQEADLIKTMAENGINYIRVRVWNDPYDSEGRGYGGGNCDLAKAIEIGKRATKYGLRLLVDFHYSDFWADPVKQQIPKAWRALEYEAVDPGEYTMDMALYEYTKNSLQAFKDAGVDVGMVQIGNETNGYMCGSKAWDVITTLMKAGSKAVREVLPKAKVVLHFANPEKVERFPDYSAKLKQYNVDYDVFASSYYPYYHGTLDNLAKVLSDVAKNYGKQVMVAETSYAYCDEDFDQSGGGVAAGGGVVKLYPFTIQGQANHLRNLTDTLVNKTTNAIGIFYWEPAWLPVPASTYEEQVELWNRYGAGWTSEYSGSYDKVDAGGKAGGSSVDNQALFTPDGHPLESLKVFALMKTGNTKVENKIDGLDDVTLICDLNKEVVLPTTVNAVMYDNSRVSVPVTWNVTAADYKKWANNGVRKYTIKGEAGGMEATLYLSMVEYNYLNNYSFEDSLEFSPWEVVEKDKKCNELYVEESANDSLTGTRHLHFWASGKDVVNFTVEQKVDNLPQGLYKSSFAIMGNDGGNTEIYLYIKVNGEIKYRSESVPINGWKKWNIASIDQFEYQSGELIVGISVKCSGTGAGAWGKIDDILLNAWTEEKPAEPDTVSFKVEKPDVDENKSVYITGDFCNWVAEEKYRLTSTDNKYWNGTFEFNVDEIKYKFIVANTENPGTDSKAYEWEDNPDRTLLIESGLDTIETRWHGLPSETDQKIMVKFSVDMSGVANVNTVSLAGNFNGWNTTKNPLTKGEDNIWSCEVELVAGTNYEFKFVLNGSGWELDGKGNRWICPTNELKTYSGTYDVQQTE